MKAVGDQIAQAVTKQPLKAGIDSQGHLTQSPQIADENLRPGEEKWHVWVTQLLVAKLDLESVSLIHQDVSQCHDLIRCSENIGFLTLGLI